MTDLKSYTAASTLPAKLIQDAELVTSIRAGYIPPVHVQLNPTNRCNLNCEFCSCSERDRSIELDIEKMIGAMGTFANLGCKSVTITGGGEPLLHPHISLLIKALHEGLKIKVGLVTNGTQFKRLHSDVYKHLTWCRISSSDDREPDWQGIKWAVDNNKNVDWAFSHVLTKTPDWQILEDVVRFANNHNFTHVRLVADLLDIEESAQMVWEAQRKFARYEIDDSKVIYQGRADYVHGRRDCRISLVKPLVGADGGIYPCCGVQYAEATPGRDYTESMKMGSIFDDIDDIWGKQQHFDGSDCVKCYYDNYNAALDLMTAPLTHKEFV